jgi:hypothetical protein
MNTFLALLIFSIILISPIYPDTRSDDHAPIGVMSEHTHPKGEFMLSYRYMAMSMNELRKGEADTSADSVRNTFMMAPTSMEMSMHMLGAMYAPNDKITYMIMGSSTQKNMDMENRMGATVEQRSNGLGDIKVRALISLLKTESERFHWIQGISIPLGSIDEEKDGTRLPYAMQLGSGTIDLETGFTYVSRQETGSVGIQSLVSYRTGLNTYGYALGNKGEVSIWKAKQIHSHTSLSLRSTYSLQTGIRGSDKAQNIMMAPGRTTSDGRSLWLLGVGVNTAIYGHRVALEYNQPLYESVQGVQMKSAGYLTFGWQLLI